MISFGFKPVKLAKGFDDNGIDESVDFDEGVVDDDNDDEVDEDKDPNALNDGFGVLSRFEEDSKLDLKLIIMKTIINKSIK